MSARCGHCALLEGQGEALLSLSARESKSDHRTFVHYGTCCEILPVPPLSKEGTQWPPFAKGAARSAGGFLSGTVPISCGLI